MILASVFFMLLVFGFLMSVSVFPLNMGGVVFVVSVLSTFMAGYLYSVFYGIVLFLVFVGGLLVAFGYAISLAPNPMFSYGLKESKGGVSWVLFGFLVVFVSFLWFLFFDLFFLYDFLSVESSFQPVEMGVEVFWGVIVLLLGFLLFFMMVAVVSMCSKYEGALINYKIY